MPRENQEEGSVSSVAVNSGAEESLWSSASVPLTSCMSVLHGAGTAVNATKALRSLTDASLPISIAAGCLTGAMAYYLQQGGKWALASTEGRDRQASTGLRDLRTSEAAADLKAAVAALPESEEED